MTMHGISRRPSGGTLPPPGGNKASSFGPPHLPPAHPRPSTSRNRMPTSAVSDRDGGRRGSWLNDTKSAAPDEAAVRRILADPSAYAARPATAGHIARAVGGQRMADSGVTRGSQFRISALEKAEVECLRCLDLQKTIKLLKHKLMEYKTRGESSLSTRLTTDLDAEVGALRKDRDALKARAELLQAIIDNQRSEDSNTQLEEENRRLITIIAELRQKMAGMQQEHAEAIERLEVNLETAKSEAQLQKKSLRETHTQVLCRLDQSLLQIEMLNTLLQTCQTEAAQGLAASEARNTALVMECRKAGVKLTESQRLLREQQEQTRLLQEENADLVVQLKRAEADCKVLTDEIVKADANARGLNDLLEGSTDRLNAFIAGQGRGSETMERDLNRLREELRIVTMELSRAKSLLTEHQNFASKLQEDLANSAQEIRKLQEKVAMAVKRREAAEEEVKVQHCKLKEEKEMLEANVKQLSDERARSDGLQQQVLVKDAEIADLQKEIHKLQALLDEMSKKANENPSTKVVVVTPKITVSLPDGSAHDHGKMNLPKHVLQELVANQLGYTPDDLFQIDDVCELGPRKRN